MGPIWGILAPSCSWKPSWPILAGPGRPKMEPRWAQEAPRWAKWPPRWRHLATKRRQEAPKRGKLGHRWELLRRFWKRLGGIFAKKRESEKPLKTFGFLRFLVLWERLAGHLEASWGPCWLILAATWRPFCHFGAMLGIVGAKMANKTGKMATKSAKMSQDGPTWVAKTNEGCALKALPRPVCRRSGPPRALEFRKE